MAKSIQALVIAVVAAFLIVTTGVVLLTALGYCRWEDIKDILEWWINAYSLLLGGVGGYFVRSLVQSLPQTVKMSQ